MSPSSAPETGPARWFVQFLDWSNADKALLIAGISLVARLVNALAIHLASGRPSFREVVHVEALVLLERSLWTMVGFWAAMLLCGLLIRRRAAGAILYATLAVQGVVVSGVWVAYLSGLYASQAVLILVGFLVLCYLAFPRRLYRPAAAVTGLLFFAASVAERLEWIPYGPLFVTAPGGQGGHPDRTVAFLGLWMIGMALALIGGLVVFNVRRLRASEALLREESRTDPLTGLPNRRYLLETARHQLAHAARHHLPISVLVIDVDRFKEINDRFGHDAGDRVLTVLARTLHDTVREEDTIARFGGDEFVAVLPGADFRDAERVAERCRRNVEQVRLSLGTPSEPVTVTVGAAQYQGTTVLTPEHIIARADRALYRAKQAGRNCVRFGAVTGAAGDWDERTGELRRAGASPS